MDAKKDRYGHRQKEREEKDYDCLMIGKNTRAAASNWRVLTSDAWLREET